MTAKRDDRKRDDRRRSQNRRTHYVQLRTDFWRTDEVIDLPRDGRWALLWLVMRLDYLRPWRFVAEPAGGFAAAIARDTLLLIDAAAAALALLLERGLVVAQATSIEVVKPERYVVVYAKRGRPVTTASSKPAAPKHESGDCAPTEEIEIRGEERRERDERCRRLATALSLADDLELSPAALNRLAELDGDAFGRLLAAIAESAYLRTMPPEWILAARKIPEVLAGKHRDRGARSANASTDYAADYVRRRLSGELGGVEP